MRPEHHSDRNPIFRVKTQCRNVRRVERPIFYPRGQFYESATSRSKKSSSIGAYLTLLVYFAAILLCTGAFLWGLIQVVTPPDYDDLYPKQGILVDKQIAGGGKVSYFYDLTVSIAGQDYPFSLDYEFGAVFRQLQPGDKLEMLV